MSSVDIFFLSRCWWEAVCFCSKTSLLIPLGTVYFVLFVCFVFHHLKSCSKEKVYTTTCPKSKVNSFPFIFQCSLPPLSVISCYLKRRLYFYCCFVLILLPFSGSSGFKYWQYLHTSSLPPRLVLSKLIALVNTLSTAMVCVIGLDVNWCVKTSASSSSRF